MKLFTQCQTPYNKASKCYGLVMCINGDFSLVLKNKILRKHLKIVMLSSQFNQYKLTLTYFEN